MNTSLDFEAFADSLMSNLKVAPPQRVGTVVRVVGMTLEAKGLIAPVGSLCSITSEGHGDFHAEVIGFDNETLYLMPFSEPVGVHPGSHVRLLSMTAKAELGDAQLGRVLDGLGRPLDGRPMPLADRTLGLQGLIINPMERGEIIEALDVGIKTINGLLTLGRGQRIGLMAGSGVGKSVLLGMMSKYTEADVVVIGLIGERGREVKEFISNSLGRQGLEKSIVIASPANESPVLRLRATLLAHLVAEYWRDQGKNVLLLVDSITRVAHAQREIGLAVGEPPATKGYPPSVFARLPALVERAGNGSERQGSITAFYTVLTEGDDLQDPIADAARAILDGHVVLSRTLADSGHYPAIDIEASISRVMPMVVSEEHQLMARRIRQVYSNYKQNQDLISIGAYAKGSDPRIDLAIRAEPTINALLQQGMKQVIPYDESLEGMAALAKGLGQG